MITVFSNGVVLLEDGATVPVVARIDNNGDECEVEDAVVAVYGTEQRGFSYSRINRENRIRWQ